MGVNIRQKPTGSGIWWIFINHHGVRKSKKIGSKKLAQKMKQKLEAKILLGDLEIESFNRTCPMFKPYAEQWLALPLPDKRTERTQVKYSKALDHHIFPVIGKMELKNIKQRHLQALFNSLKIKGMSESNFQNIKSPINHILKKAVTDEYIDHNPLVGLSFSNKRNIDIKPLTEEQSVSILDVSREYRDGIFYVQFLTLLRTGVRIGELLGLKWDDLNFVDRTMQVQRQVHQGKEGATKNGKKRTVDISPLLTETLKKLQREKRKESFKKGIPFCDWVFTRNGRNPMTPPPLAKALKACCEMAGLPKMRIHDLRHSYATIRLLKGHNIGDVSYQMGHSSIKITFDTYTHWIPGMFKSEVDDLDLQPTATQAQPQQK